MSNLPRISGRQCVKAFSKIGFEFKRQNGSHIILRIIRQANISIDSFNELL
jgi:predicted RNA binding protein YcfA (HicA-like mRNA interferase family)